MSDDIEYLKRKKFIEYMNRILKAQEEAKSKGEKPDILDRLRGFLSPDAYDYLNRLKNGNYTHFEKVLRTLVYLMLNGYIDVPVKKDDILVLDKKLSGYKGKIYVEKRGELREFSEAFKSGD